MQINEELIQEFEDHTKEVLQYNLVEQARLFVEKIWPEIVADKNFEKNNASIYVRLKKIYSLNLILQLGRLPEKTIFDLFENSIQLYYLEMIDYADLWQLIRAKLVTMFDVDERNNFKKQLSKLLLRNKNLITKIALERDGKEHEPSIDQWLIDYTSFVGIKSVDAVKMNEYFTVNNNFKKLSDEDKNIVRQLIILYERLKKSSADPEGLEEKVTIFEDGKLMVFREGRFEDLDPRISKLMKDLKKDEKTGLLAEKEDSSGLLADSEEQEIGFAETKQDSAPEDQKEVIKAYQGDLKKEKAISKLEEKLINKINNDADKLRAEFFTAVQSKDADKTIAVLYVLAKKNDLTKFLEQDQKLNKFILATWEKRYGKEFAADFSKDPGNVKFIRLFLKYILEERLKIPTNDAARVGIRIGNILIEFGHKDFNQIAYFDMKNKKFEWFEE